MELYRVTKIKDKALNKEMEESRMFGQYATALVANSIDILGNLEDNHKDAVGNIIMFTSVKPDAGWFRTSIVKKITEVKNGDFIVETLNSVYYIERDKE